MADKKKIIICWNKSEYTTEIERVVSLNNYTPIVCTDFAQFKNMVETEKKKGEKKQGSGNNKNESWKDVKGIIVLCELTWNHNPKANSSFSNLNGIILVQKYIRLKKGIKVPVLFVSFLKRKHILQLRKDAKIILTPALQHGYEQLPVKNWLGKFEQMEEMTNLELDYTILKFCDIEGLVLDVSHFVRGRSEKSEFQKCFDVMEYVINKKFINFSTELSEIKPLIDAFEESKRQRIGTLFQDLCNHIREDAQWKREK